jgi:hypothetical protein
MMSGKKKKVDRNLLWQSIPPVLNDGKGRGYKNVYYKKQESR